MKRLLLLMLFPVLAFAQTTKPPVATGSQDNVARDSIVTHRRNIDSLFLKVGVDNATRDSIGVHRTAIDSKLAAGDTVSLSARINAKLAGADTASLSTRINAKLSVADTASLSARINAKQAAGTYLIPSDTSSLTARFAAKQAAGTYLVPSDTSSLAARFSNTKVADSLTSGTLPIARMPNSGVGAGAYTYPYSVTVDQYGRVTAAVTGNKPAFGDTLLTKWADSTGLASASRAAMVWNSTLNKWQVQQAVKIAGTSGNLLMVSADSVTSYSSPADVKFVAAEYAGLPAPYYATPAAAVAAASAGDVIHIAPGVYSGGFTVAVDNLTIIGQAPAEFQSSDSTFGAGVLINGSCSAGGKKNFTMQNVTIAKRDADGDVFTCGTTGSAKINHTYINCRFVGTSWGNGYHAFLAQAGSHITIRDCKVYRSTHGFALRASYISASGLYAEDCGSESGIIIKAATGSGSASYVNVTDFTITATVAGRSRGIIVLCSNNGVRTSQINITNGLIYGTASAGVYVLQDSGAVVDVTVSSVNVRKSGTSSFWANSGSRINFINCISDSATNYGFLNSSATSVSVVGSRVNASSTYSGSFTSEIAGAVQVYGTATLGAAAVTGDLSLSGIASFDSTLYMKKGTSFLNKAGDDWHAFTTRNTSGSQAVYDVANVGTLTAFGLGTFGSLTSTGALSVGGDAVLDDSLYIKKSIFSLNKAGNNWLLWVSRDTSTSEIYHNLGYMGDYTTTKTNVNIANTNSTTVNFAGAADRINIGKSGDSVHVLGNLWAGGYDPVYGKYPLGVNGTSFLFGTVYFKDSTYLGSYNGSNAQIRFSNASSRVDLKGNVFITGSLTKGSGTFLIDHPLDPLNKTLSHSFVESPDMKNIYDGVVTLDNKGHAVVELPSYFCALNRDYRYQLTAIGKPTRWLYVAAEIRDNRFVIVGGPGQKVSWQVTGIRQDSYAKKHPVVVEKEKPEAERGTLIYPEVQN